MHEPDICLPCICMDIFHNIFKHDICPVHGFSDIDFALTSRKNIAQAIVLSSFTVIGEKVPYEWHGTLSFAQNNVTLDIMYLCILGY